MAMKKTLFFSFLIFIFSNTLFAQAPKSLCDDHAEFNDPLKVAEGVYWDDLDGKKAILDCQESSKNINELRFYTNLQEDITKMDSLKKHIIIFWN